MTTPYRDDVEATEAEYQRLSRELSDIRARETRLKAEEAAAQEEVAVLRRKLDALRSERTRPLLEDLRIAAPCSADWGSMDGDDKQRFCGQCQKDVYNLSAMTRTEAEAFIASHTSACVRLYRRADDTVITADCPVGLGSRRIRRLVVVGVGGGLLAAGAALSFRTMVSMGTQPLVTMGEVNREESDGAPMPSPSPSSSAAVAPSASAAPVQKTPGAR